MQRVPYEMLKWLVNNPNPLYPKGSTYTLEEFIPVVRAAQKMGLTDKTEWFHDRWHIKSLYLLDTRSEPYTLLQDIQALYDAPKPLTVEGIKAAKVVWYLSPDTNSLQTASTWAFKAQLIAYGVPCYATEEDCQRAQELGVV